MSGGRGQRQPLLPRWNCQETGVDPHAYFVFTLTEAANLREAGENKKISDLTPAHFKQQMQIPTNRPQVWRLRNQKQATQ